MGSLITISLLLTALVGILTSLAYLWSRVVVPFYRFCKRLGRVVDVVSDLPEWCESVNGTLQQIGPIKEEVTQTNKLLKEHVDNTNIHL